MKAVLVARDIAPSNAFEMLEKNLSWKKYNVGHPDTYTLEDDYVVMFLGRGKPLKESKDEIAAAVKGADVILVGMSSSEELSAPEIFACGAAQGVGVPYGLYADTFGCAVNRNWFDCVRADASFVFVLNEKEAEEARKVFPKAKVIASGNPTWDEFFYPKLTREESRAKLGIKEDEIFIFCPGGKTLAINMQHWGFVIETLKYMNEAPDYSERKWQVIFSRHPGDRPLAVATKEDFGGSVEAAAKVNAMLEAERAKNYAELVKLSDIPARIMKSEEMSSSDMIPGMDLMISCCSTVEIEAVCQRKPVISYIPHTGMVRMRTTMGEKWEPREQGVVESVEAGVVEYTIDVISAMLHGYTNLEVEQERFYPKPKEKGVALRAIVSTLQEFAGK